MKRKFRWGIFLRHGPTASDHDFIQSTLAFSITDSFVGLSDSLFAFLDEEKQACQIGDPLEQLP